MHIQVNSDENIGGSAALSAWVSTEIQTRLNRHNAQITRIEVHLSDARTDKSGASGKRCFIEARLEGRQPEVASDEAATLEGACTGAAKKLQHLLETSLGKRNHVKGAETIRTGEF
jgi:ribosome-associated translation inhibitor RaiA